MAKILLGSSVGKGGNNAQADVTAVRQRLRALGFDWVSAAGAGNQDEFIKTIKLFQAICIGQTTITEGGRVNGKITNQGFTHQWLAAQNAPGWVKIYGQHGTGWMTTSHIAVADDRDGTPYRETNGGYGTTWILDVITNAALAYSNSWQPDYPLMMFRDCATAKGWAAKYHGSHQTGLDIDLRLPLRPIAGLPASLWDYLGTKEKRTNHLYRDALEAQLRALVTQPLVQVIFYEDDTAPSGQAKLHSISNKINHQVANHANHVHVRIKPPARIPGQTT